MPEDASRFTDFIIEISRSEELQAELQELRAGDRESFTGWELPPDQIDIIRRGDQNEIFAAVQSEHADAQLAIWVGGLRPITVLIMPGPPPSSTP